jgi:phage terminase large subunit GpA-like protein
MMGDPSILTVVLMTSSQVGKTETTINLVGFHIDQDPAPILVIQPTLEMAKAWSKDRLSSMLRDSPTFRGKIKDPRSRDSGNTLLHKEYGGGQLTIAGANSPASLASRLIRVLVCDEVDRYPASAGDEGDPVALASKRTTTFWNRKIILTSTPTISGISRIERA